MQRLTLDAYVTDVLMPDLVGHDHRPATGLSKSSVQSAIRHLKRRGLLDPDVICTVTAPVRRVMRPWRR
jgi:hypothetical protein